MILNETKTNIEKIIKKEFWAVIPEGFSQFYSCSIARKGYSGVAFISKYNPISISYGMDIAKHDQEGRVITAEFDKFYVVGVYVPNAG